MSLSEAAPLWSTGQEGKVTEKMCLFFLAVQGGFSLIIALCFAECYLLVESIHTVFAAQLINNMIHFFLWTLYLDDTNQSFWILLKHWLKSCSWKTQDSWGNCSSRRYCFIRCWVTLKIKWCRSEEMFHSKMLYETKKSLIQKMQKEFLN